MAKSEGIGYSNKYNLEEAIKNAIQDFGTVQPHEPDQLTKVTVVEIGAEIGGIAGFDRLFVKIKK